MEFNEKLQMLRKQKGLTQEELANILFVSRTAISKWESGRGYPSIDSLKAISACFSISIDDLLSSGELLTIAQSHTAEKERSFGSLIFGLLDSSTAMFYFLPIFAQRSNGNIQEVSLFRLTEIAAWLKFLYIAAVTLQILSGVFAITMHNRLDPARTRIHRIISLLVNGCGVLIFVMSLQPYAAVFLFIYLAIKVLILTKKQWYETCQ